jgi:endoribonuclease Dicer
VVIHEVTLASAVGPTAAYAAKRVAVCALDAIEGDPGFIIRTCDCRAKAQAKKAQKKALKQMLASLQEQIEDQEMVERTLTLSDGDEDGAMMETSEGGDLQVMDT